MGVLSKEVNNDIKKLTLSDNLIDSKYNNDIIFNISSGPTANCQLDSICVLSKEALKCLVKYLRSLSKQECEYNLKQIKEDMWDCRNIILFTIPIGCWKEFKFIFGNNLTQSALQHGESESTRFLMIDKLLLFKY